MPVCFGSRIMSCTRPVMTMISQVAARPFPSGVGRRRWETMPFSVPAIIARACCCWCGGKKSMMRLTVSGALTVCSVDRTRWPLSAAERARGPRPRAGEGRVTRLLVAHLADQDHGGVLAQPPPQRALEGRRVLADLA